MRLLRRRTKSGSIPSIPFGDVDRYPKQLCPSALLARLALLLLLSPIHPTPLPPPLQRLLRVVLALHPLLSCFFLTLLAKPPSLPPRPTLQNRSSLTVLRFNLLLRLRRRTLLLLPTACLCLLTLRRLASRLRFAPLSPAGANSCPRPSPISVSNLTSTPPLLTTNLSTKIFYNSHLICFMQNVLTLV